MKCKHLLEPNECWLCLGHRASKDQEGLENPSKRALGLEWNVVEDWSVTPWKVHTLRSANKLTGFHEFGEFVRSIANLFSPPGLEHSK